MNRTFVSQVYHLPVRSACEGHERAPLTELFRVGEIHSTCVAVYWSFFVEEAAEDAVGEGVVLVANRKQVLVAPGVHSAGF